MGFQKVHFKSFRKILMGLKNTWNILLEKGKKEIQQSKVRHHRRKSWMRKIIKSSTFAFCFPINFSP